MNTTRSTANNSTKKEPPPSTPSETKGEKPQTLEEAIQEMHQDVTRFKTYWETEHQKTPEHFPLTMNPGDWFDQFLHFLTSNQ